MRRALILSLATIVLTAFCAADLSFACEKGGDKVGIELGAVVSSFVRYGAPYYQRAPPTILDGTWTPLPVKRVP